MARVTFSLPEKKSGLPKVGKRADLATAQNRLCLRLATTAARQAVGIYRSSAPKALSLPFALRTLRALRSLVAPVVLTALSTLSALSQTPPALGHLP